VSEQKRMQQAQPMQFVDAIMEHRLASEAQHRAEQFLADKSKEAAQAERDYREALSVKIVQLKAAGEAATNARDLARGDPHVAELQYKRNVAEGLRDAAAQSIWRFTADRKDLEQFLDWSKRAAFLDMEPPRESSVIGGRRAA
jgi:hypothetical protein